MADALKTEIEQFLAATILDFAGQGSPDVDPDLSPAQQLKLSDWGYGLLPQDRTRGPLVRSEVIQYVKNTDQIGQGPAHRSVIAYANISIEGVSAVNTDPQLASKDRNNIEAVVMLDLLKTPDLNIHSTFSSGNKQEYVAILNWLSTDFSLLMTTSPEGGPVINSPVANGGNTSTGTFSDDTSAAYTAPADYIYTIQVVTANTAPGSLTGLTFKWKRGSGSFSSPVAATGSYQALSDGIKILFTVATGQGFIANNSWTISAKVKGLAYVGQFQQKWQTVIEMVAGN
jgi:hypothetical protein